MHTAPITAIPHAPAARTSAAFSCVMPPIAITGIRTRVSACASESTPTGGVDSYLEVVPGAGHLLQAMFGGELAERLQLLR